MRKIRNFLAWLIILSALIFCTIYHEELTSYLLVKIIYPSQFVIQEKNKYNHNIDYTPFQNTDDFTPENKQELLNIFYTVVNSGWENFSFTCDLSYKNCISDIQEFIDNDYPFSYLNNFVHPYNSFKQIRVVTNNYGRVDLSIDKLYSNEDIKIIDNELDKIYNQIITDSMTKIEKIRGFHDYVVNNTKYLYEPDLDENDNETFPLKTNTAYGPIINHVASCNGYTDLMSLFLYKIGIQNYKISSLEHVWNLVYIDNEWKHLDLTWDDPITNTGEDILTYNLFLITSEELKNKQLAEHDYDLNIFKEAQ